MWNLNLFMYSGARGDWPQERPAPRTAGGKSLPSRYDQWHQKKLAAGAAGAPHGREGGKRPSRYDQWRQRRLAAGAAGAPHGGREETAPPDTTSGARGDWPQERPAPRTAGGKSLPSRYDQWHQKKLAAGAAGAPHGREGGKRPSRYDQGCHHYFEG